MHKGSVGIDFHLHLVPSPWEGARICHTNNSQIYQRKYRTDAPARLYHKHYLFCLFHDNSNYNMFYRTHSPWASFGFSKSKVWHNCILDHNIYFLFSLPSAPPPPLHVQCWLGHFFNLPHGWPANIQKTSRLSLGETSNTSKMLCFIFQNEKLREVGKQGTVNCIIFFWIYSRLLAQNILETLTFIHIVLRQTFSGPEITSIYYHRQLIEYQWYSFRWTFFDLKVIEDF